MTDEKEPWPSTRTCGLHSNTEFQPCEPPIWPRFFVFNRRRYSHRWAAVLRPLRTSTLRLDLCDGMLSEQLEYAWSSEPEVDDGALYLSLWMLSVSVLCKLVCNLYKFTSYKAWGKWWLEKSLTSHRIIFATLHTWKSWHACSCIGSCPQILSISLTHLPYRCFRLFYWVLCRQVIL